MEYEWQNHRGPMDTDSGFGQLAAGYQQRQQQHQTDGTPKKSIYASHSTVSIHQLIRCVGTFSIFNSPYKQNEFPSLRTPASQSFLFSQPLPSPQKSKPLPAVPDFKNPAFNTPRKFEPHYPSSEPATSPENNADSEATPDMGLRSGLARFGSAFTEAVATKKEKNALVLNRLGGTPGKGEITKGPYSSAMERKVRKVRKKNQERQLAQRKGSSASDSDDELGRKGSQGLNTSGRPPGPSTIASFFGFIHKHPDLPHILSYYAQLLLNFFLVFFFIYIIYSFWSTISSDVDKKSEEAITDILADMAVCAQNYRDNKCEKENRAPALATVCDNWERCMNKDPRSVGRARVSAHTFAEIFNSFIEPISYKAMVSSFSVIRPLIYLFLTCARSSR